MRCLERIACVVLLASASSACKSNTAASLLAPPTDSTSSGRKPRGSRFDGPAADAGTPAADSGSSHGHETNPQPAADSGTHLPVDPTPVTPGDPPPVASDAGVATDAGHDAGAAPEPYFIHVHIADAPTAAFPERIAEAFSVTQVRELYIYSQRSRMSGQHRELRKFYAPSGDLYYQKVIAFSTELEQPVPFTDRVSVPHNRTVAALQTDENNRAVLEDVFPVAGTWISDRSLTGTWTVEVYLDNSPQPDAVVSFELVP
jgi:hypothetical protein